jgi:hypothetical protein
VSFSHQVSRKRLGGFPGEAGTAPELISNSSI